MARERHVTKDKGEGQGHGRAYSGQDEGLQTMPMDEGLALFSYWKQQDEVP